MAVSFPVTVVTPNYPYDMQKAYKTIKSEFDGGQEQRRQQWRFPKRTISFTYSALTFTQFSTIWNFYEDRTGSLGTFNLFEPDVSPYNTTFNDHKDEYVARGDGVLTTFSMPGVGATALYTVYLNGVAMTTGFAITSTAGDGNSDLLTISSNVVVSTQIITVDFSGRLRLTARFTEDNMTRSQFITNLFRTGLSFTEVKRSS